MAKKIQRFALIAAFFSCLAPVAFASQNSVVSVSATVVRRSGIQISSSSVVNPGITYTSSAPSSALSVPLRLVGNASPSALVQVPVGQSLLTPASTGSQGPLVEVTVFEP